MEQARGAATNFHRTRALCEKQLTGALSPGPWRGRIGKLDGRNRKNSAAYNDCCDCRLGLFLAVE